MEKVISEFLRILRIPISRDQVERLVLMHPDYPSLLSIADTLESLGIDHQIHRIDKKELTNATFPCLLPLLSGEGKIILVKKKQDLERFKKLLIGWNGIILSVDPANSTISKEHDALYSEEKFFMILSIILGLAAVGLLAIFIAQEFRLADFGLLVTSIMGVSVGYALVTRDLGIKYSIVESFCRNGKKSSCDKVLNSEVSAMTKYLKFSDLTFIYFVSQLIIILFYINANSTTLSFVYILSALSLLTIPVILFSLFYQYKIVKLWCKLCLTIDAILIIQSVQLTYLLEAQNIQSVQITYKSILLPALILTIISTGYLFIKTMIKQAIDKAQNELRYGRIKNSSSVFMHLLFKQQKVDTSPLSHEVMLGKESAPIKVTLVSNLFCNPCKKQHEVVCKLISSYPDKINFSIRFIPSKEDPKAVAHLLQYWKQNIYGKNNESWNTEELISDWYSKMNSKQFKNKFKVLDDNIEIGESLANQHYAWAINSQIWRTPSFFINGYLLPSNYVLEDLLMFIRDFADTINNESSI